MRKRRFGGAKTGVRKKKRCWKKKKENPANNTLLINFLVSSDARILLVSTG